MPVWPHAPLHKLTAAGAYMVTASTYLKQRFFDTPERRTLLHELLLERTGEAGWQLEAWAVLTNHYHFVAQSPPDPSTLTPLLSRLHADTAAALNRLDGTPGRRVWYEFWDTHLSYERSYLARLQYVHTNPVHHGLVQVATAYPWCSAAWCERTATPAFQKVLASFKTDKLNIRDDY